MPKILRFSCLLLLPLLAAAEGDFTKALSPEERAAAGLDKLNPEELARLKAVVERYKSGELAALEQQAQRRVAATEAKVKEAEQKAALAEAKAKEAETKAAPAEKKGPNWLIALMTLKRVADKPEAAEAITSRIAGKFEGWEGKTTFKLENGQVWQQTDGTSFVGWSADSPAVRIFPGMLGTFWMEVEGVNPRVKVKPLHLE